MPNLIDALCTDRYIRLGRTFQGGTEAFFAEATCGDGSAAVLRVLIPRADDAADHEITVLRLADGGGCVRLLRHAATRGALLLERSLHELALPLDRRLEILCDTVIALWRPAPDCGLTTGAAKGVWLMTFIAGLWTDLDQPCSERAMDHALTCAQRRIAAHDDERAVLLNGDVHQ